MTDNTLSTFLVYAQKEMRATDGELAKLLRVNSSTIVRWKTGKSQPHPLAEVAVVMILLKAIEDYQNVIQQAIKDSGWKPPYHVTGTDNPIDFPT